MNDLENVNRDAFWQVMGRAMAAALARAPGRIARAVATGFRRTNVMNASKDIGIVPMSSLITAISMNRV